MMMKGKSPKNYALAISAADFNTDYVMELSETLCHITNYTALRCFLFYKENFTSTILAFQYLLFFVSGLCFDHGMKSFPLMVNLWKG
jgi:hypothetical protein